MNYIEYHTKRAELETALVQINDLIAYRQLDPFAGERGTQVLSKRAAEITAELTALDAQI